MNSDKLFQEIQKKHSFLCVGLDTDPDKIPRHLLKTKDPLFVFNKQIINATAEYCVAYKPNIAFYESQGIPGWKALEETAIYIREKYPEIFLIADAKRGDIGNTSRMYAKAFFNHLPFDAVTVAPYMGRDSIEPFLEYQDKWVILLALTSNQGAADFQLIRDKENIHLFERVISRSADWGTTDNLMYVVGATKASMLSLIRQKIPDHFLLIPGIGAQGGSLEEVAEYGMNKKCGLLVNSSRGIIYAGHSKDFAVAAGEKAREIQQSMAKLLDQYL